MTVSPSELNLTSVYSERSTESAQSVSVMCYVIRTRVAYLRVGCPADKLGVIWDDGCYGSAPCVASLFGSVVSC